MINEENKNVENSAVGGANIASTKQPKDTNFSAINPNDRSGTEGNDIASKVGSVLRGETGAIKNIYDNAKESGGQVAGQAFGQAKEKASSALDEQKTNLVAGLGSVADGIRQVTDNLRDSDEKNNVVELTAKYGQNLSAQIEKVSNYLDRKDLNELVADVKVYARRNPAVFVGAAFALGFLAARFLKSSNPNQALLSYRGVNGTNSKNSSSNSEGKENSQTAGNYKKNYSASTLDTELPTY